MILKYLPCLSDDVSSILLLIFMIKVINFTQIQQMSVILQANKMR